MKRQKRSKHTVVSFENEAQAFDERARLERTREGIRKLKELQDEMRRKGCKPITDAEIRSARDVGRK